MAGHINSKHRQRFLRKRFPGLQKKHYERGTFRNPLEEDGWKQSITKREFINAYGTDEMKEAEYGHLSNKGFGQFYMVALLIAFVVALYINKQFNLPIVALVILLPINYYLLVKIPTQIVLFTNLRSWGEEDEWRNRQSDLF